nr:hypothetical protein 9 [bacterium]
MTKEITTSIERLQMEILEIISEIGDVEKQLRSKPKLRETLRKDKTQAYNLRQRFQRAKVELSKAVEYLGKRDDVYRESIGRGRPRPVEKDRQGWLF